MRSEEIEIYIDEENKKIFRDLNKYINNIKKSVIEQDKNRDYYIQRYIKICKAQIDKNALNYNVVYRLVVSYKNSYWQFYLKNYEDVENKIISILKDGLYDMDEIRHIFDKFVIEEFKVEKDEK